MRPNRPPQKNWPSNVEWIGSWDCSLISATPFVPWPGPAAWPLTVILTLALGIGANAAIFSVVRGVLLKPLVNDDEERLVYIRQSAPGARHRQREFLGAGDQRPEAPA